MPNDLISREAAKAAIENKIDKYTKLASTAEHERVREIILDKRRGLRDALELIDALPASNTEPIKDIANQIENFQTNIN
jgi:hypothetical protein